MISISDVQEIHTKLIDSFGGSQGVRDFESLQSALNRPFQKFEDTELYPTVLEKTSALIESILTNHPFLDGNKRTGYVLARLFLLKNGLDIHASQEEKYDFIISIAKGIMRFEQILEWLEKNTKQIGG